MLSFCNVSVFKVFSCFFIFNITQKWSPFLLGLHNWSLVQNKFSEIGKVASRLLNSKWKENKYQYFQHVSELLRESLHIIFTLSITTWGSGWPPGVSVSRPPRGVGGGLVEAPPVSCSQGTCRWELLNNQGSTWQSQSSSAWPFTGQAEGGHHHIKVLNIFSWLSLVDGLLSLKQS